jgi:hypothetical protein
MVVYGKDKRCGRRSDQGPIECMIISRCRPCVVSMCLSSGEGGGEGLSAKSHGGRTSQRKNRLYV